LQFDSNIADRELGASGMAEDDPQKSWWHTLPGILTSITAAITALGGLVVAINQTNWFSRSEPDATRSEAEAVTETEPSSSVTLPQRAQAMEDAPSDSAAPDTPSSNSAAPDSSLSDSSSAAADTPSSNGAMVTLPTMRAHTLGEVEFTLLDASLAPRNSETSTLTIQVRLLNNRNYPVNFWDSQFRLLVDGIPRAPNSGLNVVVAGNAADEGDVRFIVPKSATHPQLRILFADEKTDIPLTLVHGD
jgi:hypothetical protein